MPDDFDAFLAQVLQDEEKWRHEQVAGEKVQQQELQTVFFRDGRLFNVTPSDQESWYDARYLVSDGILYDLEKVEDIQLIPVPSFSAPDASMSGYGVTGDLDYVLRMKAGNLYNRVEKALCSACLWKATQLMLAKPFSGWKKDDYYRLVYWHDELGMFDEAEKARQFLGQFDLELEDSFDDCALSVKNSVLSQLRQFGDDLVCFDDFGTGCCSECATFRGRVYSVSGNDRRFPKLPAYAMEHGNFHHGCRCTMSVWLGYDDTVRYRGEAVNAIEASNRPWTDDRTPEEIAAYEKYLQVCASDKEAEKQRAVYSHEKGIRRLEYEAVKAAFPDLAPKSLTGYSRIKTQRTKNFMKLYELATASGIDIQV